MTQNDPCDVIPSVTSRKAKNAKRQGGMTVVHESHIYLFQNFNVVVCVVAPDDPVQLPAACCVDPPPHMEALVTASVFGDGEACVVTQAHWSVTKRNG